MAGTIGHEKSCPISQVPHPYRDRTSFPKRVLHGNILSPVSHGGHPWQIVTARYLVLLHHVFF